MAHFSDHGVHCSDPYCRVKDFLPFNCDLCKKVWCLDHHKPKDHNCIYQHVKDKRVILCPLCEVSIPLPPNADANAQFDAHVSSGKCNPEKAKQAKPKRCPVKGCREQLTFSNSYACKKCRQTVCLSHRHENDHGCGKPLEPRGGAGAPSASRPATACGQQSQKPQQQQPSTLTNIAQFLRADESPPSKKSNGCTVQ